MNPVQELVAVVALFALIVASAVACTPARRPVTPRPPAVDAPAKPYTTWRVVLKDARGEVTLRTIELPQLKPYIRLTDCDLTGTAPAASRAPGFCGAIETTTTVFRFVSLEVDSMTATYWRVLGER